MSQFQLSNTKYCQVLKGNDAIVTVPQSQQALLANLVIGNKATISSSGYFGYVSEVDEYGYTFRVKPAQDDGIMQSVTPGLLLTNEIITITQ